MNQTLNTLQPLSPAEFDYMIRVHMLRGWRVVHDGRPDLVVLEKPNSTNQVLHAVLSILTFGLWLPVWLLVALGHRRRQITLTPYVGRALVPTQQERQQLGEGA